MKACTRFCAIARGLRTSPFGLRRNTTAKGQFLPKCGRHPLCQPSLSAVTRTPPELAPPAHPMSTHARAHRRLDGRRDAVPQHARAGLRHAAHGGDKSGDANDEDLAPRRWRSVTACNIGCPAYQLHTHRYAGAGRASATRHRKQQRCPRENRTARRVPVCAAMFKHTYTDAQMNEYARPKM